MTFSIFAAGLRKPPPPLPEPEPPAAACNTGARGGVLQRAHAHRRAGLRLASALGSGSEGGRRARDGEHQRRGTRSHRQPAETKQGAAELWRPPPRSRRPTSAPPSRLPCQPPPYAALSGCGSRRPPIAFAKNRILGEDTRTPGERFPIRPPAGARSLERDLSVGGEHPEWRPPSAW